MEPIVSETIEQIPVAKEIQTPVITQEESLSNKVEQYRKSKMQIPATDNPVDIGFDFKEIEAIKDPTAKDIAMKAYKSMQSGVTKKFQEAAMTKKEYETKVQEMQNWSPERIRQELNNPQFLQAAQAVAGTVPQSNPTNSGLTNEEFSALTDREKAELAQLPTLKNEINQLKQVNYQALINNTDSQLRTKYSDYNPSDIDKAITMLGNLPPNELREYVYKSIMHDKHNQEFYEMAKQELSQRNQEKLNSISVNGNQIVNNDGLPTREKGDTDVSWFTKIAQFRLAQSKRK